MSFGTLDSLVERRQHDILTEGIVQNIALVSSFLKILPFDTIEGNALMYKRLSLEGTLDNKVVGLHKLIADTDPEIHPAAGVSRSSKNIGRLMLHELAQGKTLCGLSNLCAAAQKIEVDKITPETLNTVIALCGGKVDFITANTLTLTDLATPDDAPVLLNDYIDLKPPTIFVGRFDDGSRAKGLAGLITSGLIECVDLGGKQFRLKAFVNFALYDERALACVTQRQS